MIAGEHSNQQYSTEEVIKPAEYARYVTTFSYIHLIAASYFAFWSIDPISISTSLLWGRDFEQTFQHVGRPE